MRISYLLKAKACHSHLAAMFTLGIFYQVKKQGEMISYTKLFLPKCKMWHSDKSEFLIKVIETVLWWTFEPKKQCKLRLVSFLASSRSISSKTSASSFHFGLSSRTRSSIKKKKQMEDTCSLVKTTYIKSRASPCGHLVITAIFFVFVPVKHPYIFS